MNERTFINSKRHTWEKLTAAVQRIKFRGLKSLSQAELGEFGALYRRAAADLSYARSHDGNPNLILYLNELVGEAHGVIYTARAAKRSSPLEFVFGTLPAALRRCMPFIAASFGFTLLGAVAAYLLVHAHPSYERLFVSPGMQDSIDAWKRGFADHGDINAADGLSFTSQLFTHNISVGLVAWATGITVVLPIVMLIQNGTVMGMLIAVVQPTHNSVSMWAGLLPHGVFELSAIFICGGGGLAMAWAMMVPGERSRRDALVHAGRDACLLLAVAAPLLVIAGFIEGNISHSSLPHWLKFTMAAVETCALVYYTNARISPLATETTEYQQKTTNEESHRKTISK